MNSKERHEVRYQRRKQKRIDKKKVLQEQYGDFDKVFSFKNLYKAYGKCKQGVMWKSSTKKYKANLLRNTHELYTQLQNATYRSKGFYEFDIIERGKHRHIRSVHISERCVQRTLCDESIIPLLERSLIYDNGASMKNKGVDFAIRRLETHLHRHYRKYGNEGYILQYDFKSYFDNINHDVVYKILKNIYTDKKLLGLSMMFIRNFGEKGLGLGSQVSQIMAIAVPNVADHYIKEKMHIKGYGRYMDDGYMIHHDKEYLKECLSEFRKILKELGIILNEKKTQIVKLSHGFTFLKTKFYLLNTGKILKKPCRKSIVTMRRKLKKFKKNGLGYDTAIISLNSWLGHMQRTSSYKTQVNMKELFNQLYIEDWKKKGECYV